MTNRARSAAASSSSGSVWRGASGRSACSVARIGTALAAITFLLLATRGRPWELFAMGPFTSDFYDVQARAISAGDTSTCRGARLESRALRQMAARSSITVASPLSYESLSVDSCIGGQRPAGRRQPGPRARRRLHGERVIFSAPRRSGTEGRGPNPLAADHRGFAAAVGLASPLLWLSVVYHEAELWGFSAGDRRLRAAVAWWSSRQSLDLVLASGLAALAFCSRTRIVRHRSCPCIGYRCCSSPSRGLGGERCGLGSRTAAPSSHMRS